MITLLVLALNAFLWVSFFPYTHSLEIICLLVLAIATLATLAYMPLYTQVDDKQIIVKKMVGRLQIPLSGAKITHVEASDIRGSLRLFGSCGVFGYLGWFRYPKIGRVFVLLKNRRKDLTLVETANKMYLIHLEEK